MGRRKGRKNKRPRTDPRPVHPATAAALAGRIPAPEPTSEEWQRSVAAFKEALDPRLVRLLCSVEPLPPPGEPPPEEDRRVGVTEEWRRLNLAKREAENQERLRVTEVWRRLNLAKRVAKNHQDLEFDRQLERFKSLNKSRGRYVTVLMAWRIANRREGSPPSNKEVRKWADLLGGPKDQRNFESRDIVNICKSLSLPLRQK